MPFFDSISLGGQVKSLCRSPSYTSPIEHYEQNRSRSSMCTTYIHMGSPSHRAINESILSCAQPGPVTVYPDHRHYQSPLHMQRSRDYDSPCPYTEIGAQELAGRCVCVMLDRDCAEEQDKGRNFLGRAERAYFSAAASAIQAQLSVLRFFFLLELSRKLIYLNHVIMRCSQFQNVLRRLYLHLLCFSFAVSPSFPLQRICGGHASVF